MARNQGMDLRRFYLLAIAGLMLLLGALFVLVLGSARRAAMESAEQLRRGAVERVGARVSQALSAGDRAVAGLETQLTHGLVTDLETALRAELVREPTLAEVTFTSPAGQTMVARGGTRRVGGSAPTEHPTYTTPIEPEFRGRALWSDLAKSEMDPNVKVLTVQKAIYDASGQLLGVVRAAIRSDEIDAIGASRPASDPQRVFLCDYEGRLVSRLSPADELYLVDAGARYQPAALDPALAAALADPSRGVVHAAGQVTSFSPLPDDRTQGWLVGVNAPERFYAGGFTAARDRLIVVSALIMAAVLAGGALALRAVRGGLARVVTETARMRDFDFTPARARSAFADVNAALASLEVAKTALRAMGRYVPIDLVRQLYREGREPTLGGELIEMSMMFTDIKDFTTASEKLAPDELARALGVYLEVMTRAIATTGGTIDKFIGDAVMVFWNAPLPVADHSQRACQAALRCAAALDELFASPAWAGLPRWTTRFGLHRAEVMVGHFGAPERLSYTALGDGVNLAARLEGLNKEYGTTILVSERLRQAVDGFSFRKVDRVVVKGKTEAVVVYELLSAAEVAQ